MSSYGSIRTAGSRVILCASLGALATCAEDRTPTSLPTTVALPQATGGGGGAIAGEVLVGAGNIARCDRQFDEATAAILDTLPGTVFTVGDNVFVNGSTADFASCYDSSWGRHKARTRPALGDKEYLTAGASGYFSYFGAAAGDSGAGYYSYDLTDWHVVVLNSASSSISTKLGSPQEQWLRADLAANTKPCILAYWHHPLFSSSGTDFRPAIQPLWDDLYGAHADIVINAQPRVYERFAPQSPTGAADPENGIRQFTVGTGGNGSDAFSTTIRPNSEVRSSGTYGVLKLTLGAGTYTWQFIPVAGQTFADSGTGTCHWRVTSVTVSPESASVTVGGTVQLTATPTDAAGKPVSGRMVTWQSSDTGMASVSAGGLVLGLSEGSATITATSEGQRGASVIAVTAPPPGSPAVLVGAGDIADCSTTGDEATAALLDNIPGTVFTVGDHAYPDGTATAYDRCYNASWGRHKVRTRPAPGDLDYRTTLGAGEGGASYFGYFGPLAGDSGKGYYSYDIGDWQVISLNSNIDMSAGSPQEQWLRGALAASTKRCTIAYWHHSRFTSGTRYGNVRSTQPLWEALYAAGAEMVISAHEHNYERFAPQTPTGTVDSTTGIRQFLAGTGGGRLDNDQGTPLPSSEVFNGTTWGVLKLTLGSGTYAWEFIPVAGQTFTDAGNGACHAAPSTLSASPTTIRATSGSSASTITVTAKDESGNPVSGATVLLSVTGSGNTLTQPAGTTDPSGVATGTLSSTVAESKIISATINGVAIAQTAVVTVTPAAASRLAFTVQPTSTIAGTPVSPTVQVEVRDQFGNPVTRATNPITMAIETNPAGGTLVGTTTVAAVAGVARFSDLTIDLTGTGYTLVATSGALTKAISTAFNISGGSVSVAASTVSAAPATIQAGSGVSTITVMTKDGGGNPVSGVTVTLSATGGGNTVTQPARPTDANGVTTGTLRSTVSGRKTVTATTNGLALTEKPVVTVTSGPADANQSTISAAPTSIVADTGTSTITVTVKDPWGNPVSGATVVLAATGGGNTLAQPPWPTGTSGVATGILRSTVPETKTVSATVDGAPIPQTATVTVTGQPAAVITHSLLTAGSDAMNQTVYTTAPIAPAPNTVITVAVLQHAATSAPPTPTLSGGGMTAWTEVASITFDTDTLPLRRLTIFRAMSAAPGSGAITITSGLTLSQCQWIVSQWDGVETSGANGAGAIVQTGSARGDAVSGLTVPLAAFRSSNNVAYGVFGVRSSVVAVTPGAGFAEISEQPSGENTPGDLQAQWATNLNAIGATWTNLSGGALGVEIQARRTN